MEYYIEKDKRVAQDLKMNVFKSYKKLSGRMFYLRIFDFKKCYMYSIKDKEEFSDLIDSRFGKDYNYGITKKFKVKIIYDDKENPIPFDSIKESIEYENYAIKNQLVVGYADILPTKSYLSKNSEYYGAICIANNGLRDYDTVICGHGKECKISEVNAHFVLHRKYDKNLGIKFIVIR